MGSVSPKVPSRSNMTPATFTILDLTSQVPYSGPAARIHEMASLNEPGYTTAPAHHRGSESDLGREMYYGENYLDWTQWSSQTRQVLEIAKFKPTSLIEVGPGNGVV